MWTRTDTRTYVWSSENLAITLVRTTHGYEMSVKCPELHGRYVCLPISGDTLEQAQEHALGFARAILETNVLRLQSALKGLPS